MRKMLEQHLALAEQHVTTGERIVTRQKAIVAGLDRDGRDTHAARSLLRKLEELLAIFIAHRDRLRADLAR
jgi:hypothetical protein